MIFKKLCGQVSQNLYFAVTYIDINVFTYSAMIGCVRNDSDEATGMKALLAISASLM